MNQVINLSPEEVPLDQPLDFEAESVTVDNHTGSYLVLPDASKIIPPWFYGVVVPLSPGTRRAAATMAPAGPTGRQPVVPKIQATLNWIDQPLPVNPGYPLRTGRS